MVISKINWDKELAKTMYGTMNEVLTTILERDNCDSDELMEAAAIYVSKNLSQFDVGEDATQFEIKKVRHNTYGKAQRANHICNSIRQMIQDDIIQILKSGIKEQIVALQEQLQASVEIVTEQISEATRLEAPTDEVSV